QKLDAGVRGLELTQWKQSTATKALASPPFADLDISIMPRTDWFKIYLHTQRTPAFARELHDDIHKRSAQRITDTGVNEAVAYQVVLKEMWDGLSAEEKSDWDIHRTPGKASELPVPWDEIASDPSKFYDNQKFTLPLGLKFPQTMNSVETLMLGEFFNSIRDSVPFHFTPDASRPETVPAPSNQQVERTPSLPPIPPLSTENGMSEQGKQQSGDKPSELDSNDTPQSPVSTPLTQQKRKRSKKPSNDPDGKQDHESEKELEIVPKKPRNETGKPASASKPATRRSSRKESTTQKTGKPTESRSAEVKKKSKLPKGWVPLSDDEDNSN
ncbi:hypothetical protein B0H14DRAFT_3711029, partial [Mycena olivaceomarginata]